VGFEPAGLLTARITPAGQGWDNDRLADFGDNLLAKIRALPGVEAAALAHSLPIEGGQWGSVFIVGDKPVPARADLPSATFMPVSEGYFETLKLRRVAGRFFTAADRRGAPMVAVINETAARRLWPDENPIGKRVKQGWPEWTTPWREIVGIAADVKLNGVMADTTMGVYLPYAQSPMSPPAIIIRSPQPERLARPLQTAVHELTATMPVYAVRTMDAILGADMARERASMTLLVSFAGIALVLACVGLYGLMSHLVAQRTSEIGVRVALGASAGHVIRLFLRFGLTTTIVGLAIGIASAAALTRYLEDLLFRVPPMDALAFGGAAATLFVVALVACYLPARRAARVDPTTAMRTMTT
jgi:putative ABC transport system permease protein